MIVRFRTFELHMQQRICYFIKFSRRSIERGVTTHRYVRTVIESFGSSYGNKILLQKIVLALKELCLTCVLMHIYECAITIYTVIFTFSSFNYNHVTHVANIISLLRLHIYIHGCLLLPSTIYLHNIFNGIVGNKCYNEL